MLTWLKTFFIDHTSAFVYSALVGCRADTSFATLAVDDDGHVIVRSVADDPYSEGAPVQCVALVQSGSVAPTIKVEFFDKQGRNLAISNGTTKVPMLPLTLSTTQKSIAQLVGEAGYCLTQTIPGIPNGAVGVRVWGTGGQWVPNTGGQIDGYLASAPDLSTAGTGTGPDASHLHPFTVGDYFEYGRV